MRQAGPVRVALASVGARALATLAVLTSAGCTDLGPTEVDAPVRLGGVEVDAATLNRGRRAYNTYCAACHGPRGDGMGAVGYQQTPRARDLRLGLIKFASVPSGSLPTDADLHRVIKEGLPGSGMLAWPVPDDELDAVVAWVKYLSPRWQRDLPGTPIILSENPWVGREGEAVRRGASLYAGDLKCSTCHPGKLTDSAFGPVRATDLERDVLRGGDELVDLYRAIAAGVGGTAMPSWQGQVPEADLWAVSLYVQSLRPSSRQPLRQAREDGAPQR